MSRKIKTVCVYPPMGAREFAVCMATDAFRLCIGISPRTFTAADVIRWLRLMEKRS